MLPPSSLAVAHAMPCHAVMPCVHAGPLQLHVLTEQARRYYSLEELWIALPPGHSHSRAGAGAGAGSSSRGRGQPTVARYVPPAALGAQTFTLDTLTPGHGQPAPGPHVAGRREASLG